MFKLTSETCANPGFFSGGGGGPGPTTRKQCGHRFLLFFNLFYSLQRGSNGFMTEKTILFQLLRERLTFSRRVQLFPGGPNVDFL